MARILFICAIGSVVACTARAQNNAIFTGGTGDGYARGGMAQLVSTAGIFSGGVGDGYTSNGFSQPVSTAGVFSGGHGDGHARSGFVQPESTTGIFNGGSGDGHARDAFAQPSSSAGIFSGGTGDGYAANYTVSLRASIEPVVMLEGAYDANTLLMNNGLHAAGLIPLVEPYTALGYPHAGGGGGEVTTQAILDAAGAVDWVRVELRDAGDPAALVAVRHALVIQNGSVIDAATGDEFIRFNAVPGDYFVAVRHRNHLGVMTATAQTLTDLDHELDFTAAATATFGTNARKAVGAVQVLWAGDATGNGQLQYVGAGNDRDPILLKVGSTAPNNTVSGQYVREDVNMDGLVRYTGAGNDRDPILVNVGSTTPNSTRQAQLP